MLWILILLFWWPFGVALSSYLWARYIAKSNDYNIWAGHGDLDARKFIALALLTGIAWPLGAILVYCILGSIIHWYGEHVTERFFLKRKEKICEGACT